MDDIPPQQNQSTDEYYGGANDSVNKTTDANTKPVIAASFDEMMEQFDALDDDSRAPGTSTYMRRDADD